MTKIDSSLFWNDEINRAPSPELGKEEFLKILMTQLQNQDPMNPMEDKDFISQMATFSSLEQMMNMTKSIDLLVQSQLVSPVIQYSHMIGKHVSYEQEDPETGESELFTSQVKSVTQKEGYAVLELENGEKVFADAILQVSDSEIELDNE